MRVILLCSFLLVGWSSFAQLEALEDSVFYYRSLTFNAQTDSDRIASNQKLYNILRIGLKDPHSFNLKFSKTKGISIQTSPDQRFRVFSWNVQLKDYTHKFYGLVQHRFNKAGLPAVLELNNSESKSIDWENYISDTSTWFGAVYYEVIPVKSGKNPVYFLLGWRGKDRLVSQKVIEVFHFDKSDLKLGNPVIFHGNNIKNRVIFNFPADATFGLKYDKDEKQIIFDRFFPQDQKNAGNYAFYSPQSIFDAYKFVKKKWTLIQDIDVKMPERERFTPTPPPPIPGKSKK